MFSQVREGTMVNHFSMPLVEDKAFNYHFSVGSLQKKRHFSKSVHNTTCEIIIKLLRVQNRFTNPLQLSFVNFTYQKVVK